ncbi:MAG: hypothetical protein CL394_04280 [Acidiferrobacteraceae bacterium]|jgi:uncharacterized protein YcgL (UPF0745 family)|nr:hypothetical protein [Acidiferrobacteraceae bacterium]MDP7563575.1 YcgL domain-containing protein [Arenicellales bacterium]|tara:strand:+ start:437 stop:685 length:249 start_codon:yes stop_codon:yes gene_type:complete
MKCVVYKGARKDGAYLYVASPNHLEQVPQALHEQLGKLEQVMELDLGRRRTLAAANPEIIADSIKSRGFYLQLPPAEDPPAC